MKEIFAHYSHRIKRCFKRKSITGQEEEVTSGISEEGDIIQQNAVVNKYPSNKRAIGDTAYDGGVYFSSLSDDVKREVCKIKCPHIILSTDDIKKYNLPIKGTRTSHVTVFDFKVVLQNECEFGNEDKCTLCMGVFNEFPEDIETDLLHSDRLGEFMVVKTPCRHYFHRDCLSDWIEFENNKRVEAGNGYELVARSTSYFTQSTPIHCPLCKFDIGNFKLICTNLGLPLSKVVIEQS